MLEKGWAMGQFPGNALLFPLANRLNGLPTNRELAAGAIFANTQAGEMVRRDPVPLGRGSVSGQATIRPECAGRERHFYVLPVIRPNRTHRHMVHLCAHERGLCENAPVTGNPCELTTKLYNAWAYLLQETKEEISVSCFSTVNVGPPE